MQLTKKRRETGSWNTEGNREPKSEGNRELEYGGKPGERKNKLSASPVTRLAGAKTIFKMTQIFRDVAAPQTGALANPPTWR